MFKASAEYQYDKDAILIDFRIDYRRHKHPDLKQLYKADQSLSPSAMVDYETEHITGHWRFLLTAESFYDGTYVDSMKMHLANAWHYAHDEPPEDSVLAEMVGLVRDKIGSISGNMPAESPGGSYLADSSFSPVRSLAAACPALNAVVAYPKDSKRAGQLSQLYLVIQTLNDNDKWTREQIADWLETLDLDIEVQIEE